MGHALSLFRRDWIDQSFPPKATWSASEVPNLAGKVVIVTGGNGGIGKETVKELLRKNAKVYMASRSKERSLAAIKELQSITGKEALFIELDLGDLVSVKQAANDFLSKEKQLDILINNGGVMGTPRDVLTAQGFDMQLGTNVLGHHYLVKLLMPALLAAVENYRQQGREPDVRVITVSSSGHMFAKTLEFDTFRDSKKRRRMDPMDLYNQSKLGSTLFAKEFARRVGSKGIVSNAIHPGMIKTNIAQNLPSMQARMLAWLGYDTSQGALTGLYAATSPDAKAHNGAYFIPWARLGKAAPQAEDPKLAADLWAWMEEQITIFEQLVKSDGHDGPSAHA